MKVCFIVGGDSRVSHCGVKDYSLTLAAALENLGVQTEVMASSVWDARSFGVFCTSLRSRNFDILHVQYPSIGFKWSLAPHFLGLMRAAKKTVVTLHEYSELPTVQRLSTSLFRLTTDRIFFTTDFERQRFSRSFGHSSSGYPALPIGSNIPRHPFSLLRDNRVVYFGQIKPGKGIEAFLELAQDSLKENVPCRFVVLGSVPARHAYYLEAIRAQSPDSVVWSMDLPSHEIAEVLAASLAAYLPFPDGASFRRGSMLAALVNGLPVIAPISTSTPPELTHVLLRAQNATEALTHVQRLLGSAERSQLPSTERPQFAKTFSWEEIASGHKAVYEGMLPCVPVSKAKVAHVHE